MPQQQWKEATITMFYETEGWTEFCNHRDITRGARRRGALKMSIVPSCLKDYCQEAGIVPKEHYRFRPHRSTIDRSRQLQGREGLL